MPLNNEKTLRLSAVLPCFDEEESLPLMLNRLSKVCRACVGDSYEIVCVNDGSSDKTLEVLLSLQAKHNLVVVDLFRNFGRESALLAGLNQSVGERIFVLDADMQDPPEYLKDFMKEMDKGADVVFGRRRKRPGETFFKLFFAAIFYRTLGFLSNTDIKMDVGDFFLFTRDVAKAIVNLPERQRFQRGLVAWLGGKQAEVIYDREERVLGETKFPLSQQLALARDAITGFSVKPLSVCFVLAIVALMVDLLLLMYVAISYFSQEVIPGWASLGAIMLFFSAVQLLSLGIIGEYIGKLYTEIKGRPNFIVRKVHHSKNTSKSTSKNTSKPESRVARSKATRANAKLLR